MLSAEIERLQLSIALLREVLQNGGQCVSVLAESLLLLLQIEKLPPGGLRGGQFELCGFLELL